MARKLKHREPSRKRKHREPSRKRKQPSPEEAEEDEEEVEDDEEHEENDAPLTPAPENTTHSAESESDSESDTDSNKAGPSNAPKSPVQKPSSNASKKPSSNASKSPIQKPSNAPKSASVKSGVSESRLRLWRGKDELALRNGLALFQSQNRDFDGRLSDKFIDLFHEFIKDSLQRSVSKSQLHTKLKRLKKKYKLIVEKIEDGEEVSSEDRKLFQLGKKVWGAKSSEQMEDIESDAEEDEDDGSSNYPYFEAGCSFLPDCFKIDSKRRMSSVPLAEKKEMDKAWSLYFKQEKELEEMRLGLLHRQCRIMSRNDF